MTLPDHFSYGSKSEDSFANWNSSPEGPVGGGGLGKAAAAAAPSKTVRDIKRLSKECTNSIMSSVLGVSTLAAVVGGVVLLLIRPAFIEERGKRDSIDLTRVGIWMAIIFAVVAFRDQYIQIYRCAVNLRDGIAAS